MQQPTDHSGRPETGPTYGRQDPALAETVHPLVRGIVLAATAESHAARGPARREAFRAVRFLLAACDAVGQPRAGLAAVLAVRLDVVRSRSTMQGSLTPDVFARLAGISVDDIERWREDGQIPDPVEEGFGRYVYPVTAMLAALLRERS